MAYSSRVIHIEQDEENIFIGSVPSLPGCHAEGKTTKEMMKNMQEVIRLCERNQ